MYIVQAGSSHVPDYPSLKYIRALRDAGPNKSIDLKGGSSGGRLAVAQILAFGCTLAPAPDPVRASPGLRIYLTAATPTAPHQA
jgi:hypothetical protein